MSDIRQLFDQPLLLQECLGHVGGLFLVLIDLDIQPGQRLVIVRSTLSTANWP